MKVKSLQDMRPLLKIYGANLNEEERTELHSLLSTAQSVVNKKTVMTSICQFYFNLKVTFF